MRTWLLIPAMGVVCGGAACAALGPLGLTAGLAGAALAAAVRALEGDSPASLAAAVVAPLVALAVMLDLGLDVPHASIAIAATAWTIAELGRGALATASPIVALLPAVIAAIAVPSCTVLLPIVGVHLITAPWQRPRGIVAIPIIGCLAVIAACAAGFGAFGDRWIGAAHPLAAVALPDALGDAIGPLLAVAALVGFALIAARIRHAQLAIVACLAAGLAVELRTGVLDAATLAVIALAAGTAVGRLGALIRLPAGQAFAGATLGFLLVVPPAWTAVEHVSR